MSPNVIRVAVIGAGMAGQGHAYGYRMASAIQSGKTIPSIHLAAIADANLPLAKDAAARYGFEKVYADWTEVARDPEIDAVSIVVGNHLHLPIARGLLEAGKHVLCEKPLAGSIEDAEAMADLEKQYGDKLVTATGYTVRRTPALLAIKDKIDSQEFGQVSNFISNYLCDYASDPQAPMSWRFKGAPGSGALGDLGSHTIDTGEFLNGRIKTIRGAYFSTSIKERFLPATAVVGHNFVDLSDKSEPVENEDSATFTCEFENGAIGTYTISRVAFGNPNGQTYAIHGPNASASWDILRPAEFTYSDASAPAGYSGPRTVVINDHTPFYASSMAMDAPGVGYSYGQNFAFQARAFIEQIAEVNDHLQPCASFAGGLHTLRVIEAIVKSADLQGAQVEVRE
ncbi:Gfo/Idh/MocA family protein [Rothia sp. ZJ932]|uniref:Gfo/Idh/MocA family protein n=1 Tax=Rothia sp. ZJ932 TaxID=2810516 RepID=UPI001967E959|nr:Gfo/Idh/MocA family oxidoreductase [Rothia sp. ZJ932]QRZ61477.1 Gfo/Idh/MocA family oxidoreductase [Rothia sp. ZJ932]